MTVIECSESKKSKQVTDEKTRGLNKYRINNMLKGFKFKKQSKRNMKSS